MGNEKKTERKKPSALPSIERVEQERARELHAALRRLEQELRPPIGQRAVRALFRGHSVELDIRDKILGPHRTQLLAAIACARHVHGRRIECAYAASFQDIHPWMQRLLTALRTEETNAVVREELARVYGGDPDTYTRDGVEISARSRLLQIHSDVLMLALKLNEVDQRDLEVERDELEAQLTIGAIN